MQDAFSQDMFNISDLNNPRYNGHVQSYGVKTAGGGNLSMGGLAGGMATSGKKDRKGCTKGKIEAIMRNNTVRTKVVMPVNISSALSTAPMKKSVSATTLTNTNHQQQQSVLFVQNHQVQSVLHGNRHEVVRVKDEHDDPYTFTESEPTSLGIYQAGCSTSSSKSRNVVISSPATTVQHHRSTNTMITGDRNRAVDRNTGVKLIKSSHHPSHHSVGSITSVTSASTHDQSRSGKLVQTSQDTTTRSPRTVTKRKVQTVSVKGISSGGGTTLSFNNHSHGQDQGCIKTVHSQQHYHRGRIQLSDRVCLPAKRQPRKSVWQRERNAKHELLERIQGVQAKLASYNRDLYPLGVEVSDSEPDEFELERRAVYERHWFSRTDLDVCLLDDNWNNSRSTRSRVSPAGADEETPRERKVEFARAETRRRLAQTLAGVKSAGEPSTELISSVVRAARVVPNATALLLGLGRTAISVSSKNNRGARFLTTGEKCTYSEGCHYQALPATRHCIRHIMYNVDQRLFSHCTGRLEDNTQCNRPTFDPAHVSPLCPLHITQAQATVVRTSSESRHSRKKSRMLGLSRNSKRNNKKKKKTSSSLSMLHDVHNNNNNNHHHHHHHHHHHSNSSSSSSHHNRSSNTSVNQLTTSSYNTTNRLNFQTLTEEQETDSTNVAATSTLVRLQHSVGTDTAGSPMTASSPDVVVSQANDHLGVSVVSTVGVENIVGPTSDSLLDQTLQQHRSHADIVEEVSEEVLAIEALDPVELANQTTRLLEEHDLNNVLNQISTDLAFNDLFTDKNGEYEPTREETEELERALEAVDNDVRSLERMTRSLPLPLPLLQLPLEGLLDTAAPPAAGGTSSSSNSGNDNSGNFESTTVAQTTPVPSFHNGYVGSPVVTVATVGSSNIVSDTLHQST